jgi:hypothetical protein
MLNSFCITFPGKGFSRFLNNHEMMEWLESGEARESFTVRSLEDILPAHEYVSLKTAEEALHYTIPQALLKVGESFSQYCIENFTNNPWKETLGIAQESGFARVTYHFRITIVHPWYLRCKESRKTTTDKSALLEALRIAANETPMNKTWNYNCIFNANKMFRGTRPEAHTYFSVITALGFKFSGEKGSYEAIQHFTNVSNLVDKNLN